MTCFVDLVLIQESPAWYSTRTSAQCFCFFDQQTTGGRLWLPEKNTAAFVWLRLHPRKLRWQWNITMFGRRYIFNRLFFQCHVSFRACKPFKPKKNVLEIQITWHVFCWKMKLGPWSKLESFFTTLQRKPTFPPEMWRVSTSAGHNFENPDGKKSKIVDDLLELAQNCPQKHTPFLFFNKWILKKKSIRPYPTWNLWLEWAFRRKMGEKTSSFEATPRANFWHDSTIPGLDPHPAGIGLDPKFYQLYCWCFRTPAFKFTTLGCTQNLGLIWGSTAKKTPNTSLFWEPCQSKNIVRKMSLHNKTWWIPLVVGSQTLGLKFSPSRMTDLILQDAGFTSTVSMTSSPPLSVTSPLATASASTPTPALLEPWPGQGDVVVGDEGCEGPGSFRGHENQGTLMAESAPKLLCLIPSKWVIWWSLSLGSQTLTFLEEFRVHSFRFLNIPFWNLGEVFVCQIFGGLD